MSALSNNDGGLKILSNYLLALVSRLSHETLESIKLGMKVDKSEYLSGRMKQASVMEKYLKQFRDGMNDMAFIEQLIEINEPKMSHSIEKIYQWCVYDVYENIEQHTTRPGLSNNGKRIDIQIEFFSTFIRSFLNAIFQQISMSKPFYFHRLPHQEQRQRVDLLLQPLLSKMVHPTTASAIQESNPAASQQQTNPSSDNTQDDTSAERTVDVEDEGDLELASVSSLASTASKLTSASKLPTKQASAAKIVSAKSKQGEAATKLASAVILPEPIRSAKPIEPPKNETAVVDMKHLVINVDPKPTSVKKMTEEPKPIKSVKVDAKTDDAKPVKSVLKLDVVKKTEQSKPNEVRSAKRQVVTPMKLQSDAMYHAQRQIHSATKQAHNRIQSSKSVKSTKLAPVAQVC